MAAGYQPLGLGSGRAGFENRAMHRNSKCRGGSTSGERSSGLQNLNGPPIKVKLEMPSLNQFNART